MFLIPLHDVGINNKVRTISDYYILISTNTSSYVSNDELIDINIIESHVINYWDTMIGNVIKCHHPLVHNNI